MSYKIIPEWEDRFGNKYVPGDIVAYGKGFGSAAGLKICEVVEIYSTLQNGSALTWKKKFPGPDTSKPDWRNNPEPFHWKQVGGCKVRLREVMDSQGWEAKTSYNYRNKDHDVTLLADDHYNIIKLDITKQELECLVKK